jgi:hypothetical protein
LVRLLEAVALVAADFRCAAGFDVGFEGCCLAGPAAATGSCAGGGGGSAAIACGAAGSKLATAIELDSVLWQVSQVTIVRTSAPS